MEEIIFSNKLSYGYIESVTSLLKELKIDFPEVLPNYELGKFLEINGVKEYNYRAEMRKHVGHSPIILPGGNVIAYSYTPEDEMEILIQNRNDLIGGKYSFCGGSQQVFQKGQNITMESVMLTAYREFLEETGISINDLNLYRFYDYSSTIEYKNGDKVFSPSHFFLVEIPYERITKMSKHECDDEWAHMTHSLVNIDDIDDNFIDNFFQNHRQALIVFLNKLCIK